ncbi:bicaudal-D-related protein 2-like isoform X2 [Thalassophryne amazonica]|uniref:bicaudal-D-related protein 2-like isoform X2 n=1 Tax=Thalassophryne amazonica TaxID=390379 RepID=UPI001471A6F4|nr:bicaudal-D-related protein 2-like isoform X2 [Thalassophryne amazonica]
MNFSRSLLDLNNLVKPRYTTNDQLYSTLTRTEGRGFNSRKNKSSSHATLLPKDPEPECTVTTTNTKEEAQEEDLICGGLEDRNCADLLPNENSCPGSLLKDVDEVDLVGDHSSFTFQPEETVDPHDQTEGGTGDLCSDQGALSGEGASQLQRSFIDGTIPDVINSGRPLSRRRTVGHFALKEVRKEVELSRKRSIKLKAQVDKLQQNREWPGWGQNRERVTEEILSVLKLLHPLTDPEAGPVDLPTGDTRLEVALTELQLVARKLAINHTQQVKSGRGKSKGAEESAVLQQALRDRDDAIEKKRAVEEELLRSKSEQMYLNNQLLEAIQKRLELSLELDAWKEDVQKMIQHQMQSKQAEELHKKSSKLGILRRNNRQPMQRPTNFPVPQYNPPSTNTSQVFVNRSSASAPSTPTTPPSTPQRNTWKDKFRRAKTSNYGDQEGAEQDDGFQVVSLD